MIYLDIISQKKPGYGGSNNWILLQDSYTKQKWSLFTKKNKILLKVTHFLNKMKSMKNFFRIICCVNAGKNKNLKKDCAKNPKEIGF